MRKVNRQRIIVVVLMSTLAACGSTGQDFPDAVDCNAPDAVCPDVIEGDVPDADPPDALDCSVPNQGCPCDTSLGEQLCCNGTLGLVCDRGMGIWGLVYDCGCRDPSCRDQPVAPPCPVGSRL